MKTSRYSEAQIIVILRQAEGGVPMARDSRPWNSKRFIRGGRAVLRHALFMRALDATHFNVDFNAKYQALTAAGKAPKVAMVAVMRNLVVLANALLKKGRTWEPKMT